MQEHNYLYQPQASSTPQEQPVTSVSVRGALMASPSHLGLDGDHVVTGGSPADDAVGMGGTGPKSDATMNESGEAVLCQKKDDTLDTDTLTAAAGTSIVGGGDNNAVTVVPGVPGESDLLLSASSATHPIPHPLLDMNPPPPQAAEQAPAKRKRKQYSSEEERRQARILKNRRTAEESRQRRLKRMKELEDIASNAAAREAKLYEEIRDLKAQLDLQAEQLESMRRIVEQRDVALEQRNLDIKRLKIRK